MVHARSADVTAHAIHYSAHLVLNFGLLGAMVVNATNSFVHAHLHLIAIIGAELSLLWFLVYRQGRKTIATWDLALMRIQEGDSVNERQLSWLAANWRNMNLLNWTLPSLSFLGWCMLFLSKPAR
jgi:hypothetical protein